MHQPHDAPTIALTPGRVRQQGETLRSFDFPHSRRRLGIALAALAVFMVLGAIAAILPGLIAGLGRDVDAMRTGGLLVVIASAALAEFGRRAYREGLGRVRLTSAGIHDGSDSAIFIPWSVVQDMSPFAMGRSAVLGIRVSDADRVRIPARLRRLSGLNRRSYGVDVGVGSNASDEQIVLIAAAIAYYVLHPEERAAIGLHIPPALVSAMHSSLRAIATA